MLTNKTKRCAHHAVCARAVRAGAVRVLLETLREHHQATEFCGDVLRVLSQLLGSQRGAATPEEAEEAQERARALPAEHADNFTYGANVQVQAEALLRALALPARAATQDPGAPACLFCCEPASQRSRLKRCGRCKSAQYCSTTCQREDWAEHKPECREAAAQS